MRTSLNCNSEAFAVAAAEKKREDIAEQEATPGKQHCYWYHVPKVAPAFAERKLIVITVVLLWGIANSCIVEYYVLIRDRKMGENIFTYSDS